MMINRRSFPLATVLLMVAVLLFAFPAWSFEGFVPVRLDLQWYPQTQFAGFYVAYEKGFYLRRGLNVFVNRGGPDRDPLRALEDGSADFVTLFLSAALRYHDRGVPLVNICQIVNRGNLVLVARRDRGIESIRNLDGRRISLWGENFSAAYHAFFRAHGITPVLLPQYSSVSLFLKGGVDVCSAMSYNEYHGILLSGVRKEDLLLISMYENGFGSPEDGIYCLKSTQRESPEVCAAFAEATMEGWRYAAEHPEEAVDIVMNYVRYAHVPANRVHMKWMLEDILPSIIPGRLDDWKMGRLSRGAYLDTAFMMHENGLIDAVPRYEDFVWEVSSHVR